MHTMDHDGPDEFHQVHADVEETAGPIEKFLKKIELKNQIKEERAGISPQVQAFLDECDRLIKILRNDELFEKERQKYKNDSID